MVYQGCNPEITVCASLAQEYEAELEPFIDFGFMCPIAQIGKNHVNKQR